MGIDICLAHLEKVQDAFVHVGKKLVVNDDKLAAAAIPFEDATLTGVLAHYNGHRWHNLYCHCFFPGGLELDLKVPCGPLHPDSSDLPDLASKYREAALAVLTLAPLDPGHDYTGVQEDLARIAAFLDACHKNRLVLFPG